MNTSGNARRITPAYAGKSPVKRFTMINQPDHPRLRGEKCERLDIKESLLGSPPLTRGKGYVVKPITADWRITPAYAGKSFFDCLPDKL